MTVSGGRFEERVLLTTGGGSGLAAAAAERFSAEGGRVAVLDLELERAEAVAELCPGSIALAVDVADEDAVVAAVASVHERLGQIDCAFNAAGFADFGPLEEWSLARWNRMMAVHVGGTFLVCRELIPIMRAQGQGSIVNTGSIAALVGQSGNAPYGAAKGAIISLSRQLALDLAPAIRINVVAPGRILTAMTRPLYAGRGGGDLEKGLAMMGELNPMRRLGEPEEVAGAVCFLLADDASFITGQVLVPDGGETVT
jgi:NAD(P)-dependent dehydrogenase (short-subunit alcohol dehydrogenase family)